MSPRWTVYVRLTGVRGGTGGAPRGGGIGSGADSVSASGSTADTASVVWGAPSLVASVAMVAADLTGVGRASVWAEPAGATVSVDAVAVGKTGAGAGVGVAVGGGAGVSVGAATRACTADRVAVAEVASAA